jgi:TPP-dependent pyruvate/acetoin dehydrogenase alpha subunit
VARARETLDCLKRFRGRVTETGQLADHQLNEIDNEVARLIDEAVAEAKAAPKPSQADLTTDVYVRY